MTDPANLILLPLAWLVILAGGWLLGGGRLHG